MERFGCPELVLESDPRGVTLSAVGSSSGIFFPPFLDNASTVELLSRPDAKLRMLPADDFVKETIEEQAIPVLFIGDAPVPRQLVSFGENEVRFHFDLLGTVFFILTRMEEIKSPIRDEHGRFPASASHALQNGYLHRPVVDEYMEILWRCIYHLWPGAERKQDSFRMMVTHDVDSPFEYLFRPAWKMLRSFGSDIIRRRSPRRAFNRAAGWFDVKHLGSWQRDPFYTFDTMMDISVSHGLKSAFYFLTGRGSSWDGEYYDLKHPRIAALMKRIHDRGHEIGYHGSYTTYRDPKKTKRETQSLRDAAARLGIFQETWGGRQHYLRWKAPVTWRNYAEAGLDYDTTLSYADHAGFRCGTCHPFQVFDVEQGKALNLIEYPLVVMECSVLDERYMNLPHGEALDYILQLKRTCCRFGGCFSLLWHNSRFVEPAEMKLYKNVLEG